ncbi:MAG: hypothetical protein ABIE94_07340 [archaeon]
MQQPKKAYAVRFIFGEEKGIQTQIESKGVSPLEAIGLLEMAKDQMMNNLRKGTQNVFKVEKK